MQEPQTAPGSVQTHGWTIVVHLTAMVAAALPVLLIEIPGLVDYLNHLARIHILANLQHSPELQWIYRLGWPPPPNVLGDLVLPAFAKVFDLYLAGRVYLLLCFTLIIGGLILLTKTLQARIFMNPKWLSSTTFTYQGKTMNSYWGRWPEKFDYVLLVNDRWERNPYPRLLTRIRQGSFFELYRVSRPGILRYR